MSIFNAMTAAIPIANAWTAYKRASFKVPGSEKSYELELSEESKNFARDCGLRDGIRIFVKPLNGNVAFAHGSNSITQSDIGVWLDPSLTEDRLAANATLRHEYTHIRHNDRVMQPLIKAVATTAVAILGLTTLDPLSTWALTFATSIGTEILYSRFAENRADDAAIEQSTTEELRALLDLFKQAQRSAIYIRENTSIGFLFISTKGNRYFNFSHPALSDRIQKIENAIKTRLKQV